MSPPLPRSLRHRYRCGLQRSRNGAKTRNRSPYSRVEGEKRATRARCRPRPSRLSIRGRTTRSWSIWARCKRATICNPPITPRWTWPRGRGRERRARATRRTSWRTSTRRISFPGRIAGETGSRRSRVSRSCRRRRGISRSGCTRGSWRAASPSWKIRRRAGRRGGGRRMGRITGERLCIGLATK